MHKSAIKILLATATATALAVVAGAAPAGAATVTPASTVINYSCGPAIDPNNTEASTRFVLMQKALPDGGYVELRAGFDAYYDHYIYWTRTVGTNTRALHLDWSDDGGSTYHICNQIDYGSASGSYTWAVNDWGGRTYKAFAEIGSTWYGSASWQH